MGGVCCSLGKKEMFKWFCLDSPKEMSLTRKENYTRMGLKYISMEWICLAQDSDK